MRGKPPLSGGGKPSEEPPVEPPNVNVDSDFDYSKAKPEEFMCFGTIEPQHPECKECPFRAQCAEKAGVKI